MAKPLGITWHQVALYVPVALGEQFYHALLRRAGCVTTLPTEAAATQVEALERATLPPGMTSPSPELTAALARFGLTPPE
jgi:hypothetical protein